MTKELDHLLIDNKVEEEDVKNGASYLSIFCRGVDCQNFKKVYFTINIENFFFNLPAQKSHKYTYFKLLYKMKK